MPNHKSALRHTALSLLLGLILMAGGKTYAFEPDFYAASSALAQGNWAKVELTETGMHFISDATIRSLGFSDPEKVNVFGYGGVVIPENLDSPDDLPLVPSLRVKGGLVFFGRNSVGWKENSSKTSVYSHLSHPYSDHAYYFLSDCLGRHEEPELSEIFMGAEDIITEFTQRLVHEQDLTPAMITGRLMLGEDFKSTPSRNFTFSLPGNIGNAKVTTAFASKTSGGTSSIVLTANGKQLPATTSDQMNYSSTKLIVSTVTVKEVEDPGTTLNLTIKFNGAGNVSQAALDYIEVEYPRSLVMTGSELYFYMSPKNVSAVQVSGVPSDTRIFDVTDPAKIVEMPIDLSGGVATFFSDKGYHEYIAFSPSAVSRGVSPVGSVANQNIHSMEAPGLLVISPAEYLPAAHRLEGIHQKSDGLSVAVLTPEAIYNEFSSGKADVSAFRKLLKMWYDRAGGREGEYTAYCIIMSRPTYDNKMLTAVVRNAGYPRIPIWQSASGETATTSYSTDDYIGMLGDVKGTFNIGTAAIHTSVGRMPVKSLAEAHTVLDKLEDYLLRPDFGAWRSNIMIIADDGDNGVHLDQAEKVVEAMQANGMGKDFLYEKLYLDAYTLEYSGTGGTYRIPHDRLMKKWNEGLAYIDYIGHANQKMWGHENLLTWNDITTMSNTRLPFLYAATCEFMRWDEDEISGAEILWLMPNSGYIGTICPSREVLISANGVLNKSVSQFVFMTGDDGKPLPVGEIMRRGKNDSNTGTNKLRYGLMGDPSMRMPWPLIKVKIDEINGVDLSETEDFPMLCARSKVKLNGHIENQDGSLMSDFNGVLELQLYDAEKVITTNGNQGGVKSQYNDRNTRLFVGKVKVKDGKWEVDFTMPAEIENNYSPALFAMYASDGKSREANGTFESFYVYGYDENAPDDFEGPKILEFYLDSPSFESGSQVSPNPVLYVKVYDDSGISVSEAGIGHNITLDLDGKKFYDDIAQYYEPDITTTRGGSIVYPIGEIPQGDHTLKFTVWDTANNSSTASIKFTVSALWKPTIELLTTDVNPATTSVNFIIGTDGTSSTMECMVEVFDVWGKKVWNGVAPSLKGNTTRTTLNWNLCDFGGGRVPAGIYLYRATIKMDNGATVSKTKKLVVK